MAENIILNTRDCLNALSTNANVFKAFLEKYNIESVKEEKNQKFYDLKQIVKYWVQNAKERTNDNLDRNSEDARLKKAQADIQELKLAQMKGELLDKNTVELDISEIITIVKTKLLNMPGSLTDLVFGIEERQKVNSIMKQYVFEVLTELERMADVPKLEIEKETIDETPIEVIQSTAKDDSKPMEQSEPLS